jgi:hypothetical protein
LQRVKIDQGGDGEGQSGLNKIQELNHTMTTMIKEVDYYCKGKIMEHSRKLDKLDMITEPVKILVLECRRNTDDIKLKTDCKSFDALVKKLNDHHPSNIEFSRLQNTVTMKAEWDDHNDLTRDHRQTKEDLKDTREELRKLKESYMEFCSA